MIGSLFSGIGGLELGLERAGLGPVAWQCEIDPFCRAVLAKHWPNATRFVDVTQPRLYPDAGLICGGFPCQDVSSAGKRRGIGGARSGLWWYFASVVQQVRPRVVVVENVASGAKAWLPHVRHQLHVLGYRTRAYAISAADVGAPHMRRRVFVVAHAHRQGEHARAVDAEVASASAPLADAHGAELRIESRGGGRTKGAAAAVPQLTGWRSPQPDVVRVVHGVPRGVDGHRRRALGNSVVPQCAEAIGRMIAASVRTRAA